jgi:hypothetical protein
MAGLRKGRTAPGKSLRLDQKGAFRRRFRQRQAEPPCQCHHIGHLVADELPAGVHPDPIGKSFRLHPPANAVARFEHDDIETSRNQRITGRKAGKTGTGDDHICIKSAQSPASIFFHRFFTGQMSGTIRPGVKNLLPAFPGVNVPAATGRSGCSCYWLLDAGKPNPATVRAASTALSVMD